ncbi:hypothetical protein EcWSU1_03538 [Enterobacter ludwigii]|uniref:Uncharacterized protein n=1 Tax=Enterobacter ludwigii TaxID=299767 RepID=G8LPP1_9ENTR|nr:hypothetical protein EcWSU1_03538 [Enterobacter ludwigii]
MCSLCSAPRISHQKEGQGEGISLHKIPYFSGEFLRSML